MALGLVHRVPRRDDTGLARSTSSDTSNGKNTQNTRRAGDRSTAFILAKDTLNRILTKIADVAGYLACAGSTYRQFRRSCRLVRPVEATLREVVGIYPTGKERIGQCH